jgi:hypothetical protein
MSKIIKFDKAKRDRELTNFVEEPSVISDTICILLKKLGGKVVITKEDIDNCMKFGYILKTIDDPTKNEVTFAVEETKKWL